jgi:hypothetical protein
MITMSPMRPRPGRLLAGLVVPLALLALPGCADEEKEPAVPNAEIAAGIQDELSARDDVAGAEVRYRDDFSNPSTVTADITMADGADAQALAEEGARLIWVSDLEPLTSFAVHVVNPADPPSGVTRVVSFAQESERAPLEEKYGPRPD